MKQLLSNLLGSTVDSTQGPCGTIRDFYFDDHHWVLRYLVCQLPRQEGGRFVLIPSGHFLAKEWDLPVFPVAMEPEQIRDCHSIDAELPVSRQKFESYSQMIPWTEVGGMGIPTYTFDNDTSTLPKGDPNLRSFEVVRQYRVEAPRGILGWVKDFVIDDNGWFVHGLIIKLKPWYQSKTIMVSPHWAKSIDWADGAIWTDAHPLDWQAAPEFSVRRRPATLF